MPKRFTESAKWVDPWFRSLTPNEKLVFLFLVDNCDLAGFYELDLPAMSFLTGLESSPISGAIQGLFRGIEVADDKEGERSVVWVRNFLRHQSNLPLNPANNAHKRIIELIQSRLPLFPDVPSKLGAVEGLFSPIGKSKGKGNVKVKSGENSKFVPPTVEECLAYAAEIELSAVEAKKYHDRNTSIGWRVGDHTMKDWRASMRYWKANVGKFNGKAKGDAQTYTVHTDLGEPWEDAR